MRLGDWEKRGKGEKGIASPLAGGRGFTVLHFGHLVFVWDLVLGACDLFLFGACDLFPLSLFTFSLFICFFNLYESLRIFQSFIIHFII